VIRPPGPAVRRPVRPDPRARATRTFYVGRSRARHVGTRTFALRSGDPLRQGDGGLCIGGSMSSRRPGRRNSAPHAERHGASGPASAARCPTVVDSSWFVIEVSNLVEHDVNTFHRVHRDRRRRAGDPDDGRRETVNHTRSTSAPLELAARADRIRRNGGALAWPHLPHSVISIGRQHVGLGAAGPCSSSQSA